MGISLFPVARSLFPFNKLFPKDELYGMVQQIRRSAASIPANIAEGYGRRSTAEYIRFLNIAQGSLNELETHIILSQRVGLCSQTDIESIILLLREESRMIIALIKKLQQ
ncbi:four helix bundle protein [Nostoc sp.]